MKPTVSTVWADGEFTMIVQHNGPVDVTIKCSGTATGKLTTDSKANFVEPEAPPVYTGTLQHEAELFDTRDVEQLLRNAVSGNIRDFYGQGYLVMGMAKGASARDTVTAAQAGSYTLNLRYRAKGGNIAVYVNGSKHAVELSNTDGSWGTAPVTVKLKKGKNTVEIRMTEDLESKLYIDCFTLDLVSAGGGGLSPVVIALIAAAAVIVIAVIVAVAAVRGKKKK